jgi:hypothetical protein
LFGFRKAHGEVNYRGLLRKIANASADNSALPDPEKKAARRLLSQCFAWFDPKSPQFLDAVTFVEQKDLIEALSAFPSSVFDTTLRDVFRRSVALKANSLSRRIDQGDIAVGCARQVTRKQIRNEIMQFLAKLLQEFKEDRKDSSNSTSFPGLDGRIQLIQDLIAQQGKDDKKNNPP